MNRVAFLAIILLGTQNLVGFPYRFTRLIKTDESGKIERTVDLIYDIHKKIYRYSKFGKKLEDVDLATFIRWMRLSASEIELINTLNELADNSKEKIDLIWEWSTSSSSQEWVLSFLGYMGKGFEQDFKADKNRQVRFVFGDNYRKISNSDFGEIDRADVIESLANQKIGGLIVYLDAIIAAMKNDLNYVKSKVSSLVGAKLEDSVDAFQKKVSDFLKKFGLIDTLTSEKSAGEWIKSLQEGGKWIKGRLISERYLDFVDDWMKIGTESTMNLEVVLKIFGTDVKHVIVYAGGKHCKMISEMLINDFGFKVVTDIGNPNNKNIVGLDAAAWKYLKEMPEESIKRAAYINVMPARMWQEDVITSIFSQALDDPNNGLQQLEKLLGIAKTAYVDLVNAQDDDNRSTMLHKAVKNDVSPVIDLLLQYGADTNISDRTGSTPLHYANSAATASMLLEHNKAIINKRNDEGKTPLHRALMENKKQVVEELLKKGADVHITDQKGNTPLHYATNDEAVSKLLEYGAVIDARNKKKRTPLQKAVIDERRRVVRKLLEHGADPNEKFEYGDREYFPYDFTESRRIKKFLKKYGAKSAEEQISAVEPAGQ